MFEGIRGFMDRHKWKLSALTVGTTAFVLVKRELDRRLQEMADKALEDHLKLVRRQTHFESNEKACNITVEKMLPELLEELEECTGNTELLEQLKSGIDAESKLNAWSKLCVGTIVGVVAGSYVISLLVVLLRVQLNVLGGYLYLSTVPSKSASHTISVETQREYLELTTDHLKKEGVKRLVEKIREIVVDLISTRGKTWIQAEVDHTDLRLLFSDVRQRFEDSCCTDNGPFTKYLLPDRSTSTTENQIKSPPNLSFLTQETLDVLETPLFKSSIRASVDKCLDHVDASLGFQFSNRKRDTPEEAEKPFYLFRLMPTVQKEYKSFFTAQYGPLQELLIVKEVKELSASLYESFSELERDA